MTDFAALLMTVTFCLQVIGYGALISTQGLQRKRLDRLTLAVIELRGGALDRCACESTNGKAGDSK